MDARRLNLIQNTHTRIYEKKYIYITKASPYAMLELSMGEGSGYRGCGGVATPGRVNPEPGGGERQEM